MQHRRNFCAAFAEVIIVRNGSFGLLWTGQLLSSIGTWFLVVAVPVYVFHLTASARDTGLASVAEVVPMVLLGPFAGVFVDRWSRRTTMIASSLLQAGSVSALVFFTRPGQFWILISAVFAENAIGTFFVPAYLAVVPMVVGRRADLDAASAWTSVSRGITRVAGAPLGGALYAIIGFKAVVAADAVSYVVSAALVALMPALRGRAGQSVARAPDQSPARRAFPKRFAADLRIGVTGLLQARILPVLLAAAALFWLGNGALAALLVPYVSTELRGTPAGVGVLYSALGAGYLVGALPGKFVCANSRLRRNLMTLLAAVAAAFAGVFNIHVFALALVFIGLAGIPGNAFLTVEQNLMQRCAPDKIIGRIGSVYSTAGNVATVTGGLLASLLVRELGLSLTLNCSIGAIACAGAVAALLPRSFAATSADRAAMAQTEPRELF